MQAKTIIRKTQINLDAPSITLADLGYGSILFNIQEEIDRLQAEWKIKYFLYYGELENVPMAEDITLVISDEEGPTKFDLFQYPSGLKFFQHIGGKIISQVMPLSYRTQELIMVTECFVNTCRDKYKGKINFDEAIDLDLIYRVIQTSPTFGVNALSEPELYSYMKHCMDKGWVKAKAEGNFIFTQYTGQDWLEIPGKDYTDFALWMEAKEAAGLLHILPPNPELFMKSINKKVKEIGDSEKDLLTRAMKTKGFNPDILGQA